MKLALAAALALSVMPFAFSQEVVASNFMMITLAVQDMDKSKDFYTAKLGLQALQDNRQGAQRWVALAFPGGGASMNLSTVMANGMAATSQNIKPGAISLYFATPDIKTAWKALKERGVTPATEVSTETWSGSPWAAWFTVEDPDKNQILIVQMKSSNQ